MGRLCSVPSMTIIVPSMSRLCGVPSITTIVPSMRKTMYFTEPSMNSRCPCVLGRLSISPFSTTTQAGKFSRKVGKFSSGVLLAACRKARQFNKTHQVTHRVRKPLLTLLLFFLISCIFYALCHGTPTPRWVLPTDDAVRATVRATVRCSRRPCIIQQQLDDTGTDYCLSRCHL